MFINKKVLFVEGTQGFVNQAIVNNLENLGLTVVRAGEELNEISPHCDEADIILFYPAGSSSRIELIMDYLLEVVKEDGKTLCLIGEEPYITIAKNLDTEGKIFRVYARPVNIGAISEDIRRLYNFRREAERSKHILVIDDDPDFLFIMNRWLKSKYMVDCVRSGMEALFYLNRKHPDLILLDYEMPEMDGYQLMEKIRRNKATVYIPIIFLTGKNDRDSVMRIIKRKPDGYLLKSMKKEELMDTLDRFFAENYITENARTNGTEDTDNF